MFARVFRSMARTITFAAMIQAIFLEAYRAVVWHVMIRFGRWDDIIAEPMDEEGDVFPTCIATGHYARGLA
jgi:hypothetical protein